MQFLNNILPGLNLILIFIIPIFYYFYKSYLISYLSESAKSNVQKKDISELTQKVESIKASYSKEVEVIKFRLNELLSLNEHHRTEERNALIKFHSEYIHWIYLFQSVNLADYNFNNLTDLLEKKLSLNDYFYKIHLERANVLLIVNDDALIKKTYDLIQKLIEYKSFIESSLLSLQILLEENRNLIDKFSKLLEDYDKNKSQLQKIADNETAVQVEIKKLKESFNNQRVEQFLSCRNICDDFASSAKAYLVTIRE